MESDTLARLDDRMARMEATLERLVGFLDAAQPQIAMVGDIADEWVATKVGGDQMEVRLAALEDAVLRLTEPDTLSAVVRLAELSPKLERVAELAAGFDDTVAMTADIADEWVNEKVGGDALDGRLQALQEVLLKTTTPSVLCAMTSLAELSPRLLRTAEVAAELDAFVDAMADALMEPIEPVGPVGVLLALRDPEVQRGVGRAIHVTRHLGRHENLLPVKH